MTMHPPTSPDHRFAAAREGCREALGDLLESQRRYLLRVARELLDPSLSAKGGASDLVQDAFRDAHRNIVRFVGDTDEELRAWLRRILLHRAGRFVRRYGGAQKRAVTREVVLDPASAAGRSVRAEAQTPSAEAIERETGEELQRALARLPEDARLAVVLRHRDGLAFEEIGRRLGRSSEAARKLWARAVNRLRTDLGVRE